MAFVVVRASQQVILTLFLTALEPPRRDTSGQQARVVSSRAYLSVSGMLWLYQMFKIKTLSGLTETESVRAVTPKPRVLRRPCAFAMSHAQESVRAVTSVYRAVQHGSPSVGFLWVVHGSRR